MRVTLKGLQEAQTANGRMIAALQPLGAMGDMVRTVMTGLHRYAVTVTHVWRVKGGGLRASHRMVMEAPARARIFIDPTAVNPRGQRPAEYGGHEHARGGSHAFYERTVNEAGERVVRSGISGFIRRLPR